jgi:methionyl-tRNA formyltransferase
MKLIFMGSGRFAVPSLRALLDSSHTVAALITQPDKPAGRGHALRPPPTKALALERSIPVHQPKKVRTADAVETIKELEPDCIVVAAYGQIIPKSILDIPPKGIINVHASILPAYRGAAPIQWAIMRGETETGITTMLIDEGMDTGAILLQNKIPIEPEDTSATLEDKLAFIGADLILETLERWKAGSIEPVPQDDSRATLAPRIKQEDAIIDWNKTAAEIDCAIRGFIPWPVAHTNLRGKTVKLWSAAVTPPGEASPGKTISVGPEGILVGCGGGTRLRLLELQAEGKNRMAAAPFARGQRLAPGDRWGESSRHATY